MWDYQQEEFPAVYDEFDRVAQSAAASHANESGFESTDPAVKEVTPLLPIAAGRGWRTGTGRGSSDSLPSIIHQRLGFQERSGDPCSLLLLRLELRTVA